MNGTERRGILTAIVRFSLRFRGIIISLAVILIGYGIYTLALSKYDVFPEFAPPQVVIQTEAPGLSPAQVEQLVTQPIENSVNGVTGIKSIRSGSIQGLSVVTIIFNNTQNIYLDRQAVSERLSTLAGTLPLGVHSPIISPLTSSTSVVMTIGLQSDEISLMKLRTAADWTVKQRILAVPGVAKIAVYGGDVKEFQIQITPEKLIKYHLSINDILKAAKKASGIKGGGYIDTHNQRVIIHTEGQSLTTENIAKTVIFNKAGISVTLGDVAKVVVAPANKIGAALINGKPGVAMVISSQYGANTLDVTNGIVKALAELKPALSAQGIKLDPNLFKAAAFIDIALSNITSSLLIGAILVIIVLTLFLFNFRTAAISCIAIPLSLLTAVTLLDKFGISLNTMTLGGLAIAIGEVVDDAVIDVENIMRRLRENKELKNSKSVFHVILDASIEVRSAVVYATFAVVLVFMPILMMSGIAGKLFAPLGIAYILSIMASLIVALTVTPALSFLFLGNYNFNQKEPLLQKWIKEKYHRLILRVEKSSKVVILSVALFTIASLAMIPFFGGGFIPELRENYFILHMTALPGTSLNESLRIGEKVTAALLKLPFVKSADQRAGRAELGDDILGTHDSEIDVRLIPMKGSKTEKAQEKIRSVLKDFAGVSFALNTFLSERIEETLSGYTASVVINIFGNDLNLLDAKAEEVSSLLQKKTETEDVKIQSPQGMPELVINLNKNALQKWGVNTIDVLNDIQTAYEGKVAGQIFSKNRVFDLTVKLNPQKRNSVSEVALLPIKNSNGNYVMLGQLADIHESSGRYIVLHQGARRVQTITCNVAGGNVKAFYNQVKKEISKNISLPQGFYFSYSGAAVEQSRSSNNLIVYSIISLVGIILLLSVVMKNYRNLLLVLINLPFALVGGVLMIFFTGRLLSMGSLVGFVTLFGITLRNSIMLISHYEHLINFEGMVWGLETAIRGASERLIPILMTALVTGLGLLPLAIGSGDAGREIEGPMALVILGGLATSTALNLLVLPTLSLKFGKFVRVESEQE